MLFHNREFSEWAYLMITNYLRAQINKSRTDLYNLIFNYTEFGTFKNGQWKVRHSVPIYVVDYLVSKVFNWVMIWQLNYFFNPPKFTFSPKSYCLVLPRFTFILGRTSLIFQNSFDFSTFFRNFGSAEVTGISEMKEKQVFLLHFPRFFVTLQRFMHKC